MNTNPYKPHNCDLTIERAANGVIVRPRDRSAPFELAGNAWVFTNAAELGAFVAGVYAPEDPSKIDVDTSPADLSPPGHGSHLQTPRN